jgi:hypothetical protein
MRQIFCLSIIFSEKMLIPVFHIMGMQEVMQLKMNAIQMVLTEFRYSLIQFLPLFPITCMIINMMV